MRHVITTLFSLILSFGFFTTAEAAHGDHFNNYGYNNSLIFNEDGITFSVFPDGEFDFFIDNPAYVGAGWNSRGVSISFNAGFNYDPWVQYDDYGAIIQVENTPVYYDFYGRVSRIGNIDIFYRNGRVARVGGLQVFYNPAGAFVRFSGFINVYNRHFAYRPVYNYFVRPASGYCVVDYRPYRRYYSPVRYTWYRPYQKNYRRAYANVGRTYHYKDANPRRVIYRNDRRVAGRKDQAVVRNIRGRSLEYQNSRRAYAERQPQKKYRKGNSQAKKYSRDNYKGKKNNEYKGKKNNGRAVAGYNKGYKNRNNYGRPAARVTTKTTTVVNRQGKTVKRSSTVTKEHRGRPGVANRQKAPKTKGYAQKQKMRKAASDISRSSKVRGNNQERGRRTSGRRQ